MILIEDDIFMPKYETFFLTASILSAVYLILFLVYLLYKLQIITGHESIQNLGFYMCIINIVFLLNPFKILNYEGRRYYLTMLGKFMISFFRPMNMNIYAFATTIGSFVQPFSDFSYTVC
jgi:ABC-type long-subunit fatty acid transport system fused permease/ATPase subunit